ncbi:MAG TPA: hypothetical protein VHB27_19550 [Rhodopila sp.]|uniref:hypothetical protein n=1 Tax=Rhodopila sp. TaxID=2480087 RepID=UPI002BC4D5A4|nr:hypothetical protein [Rhodopila sp.]HVY17427.1 hypothetical protein [Rhodopila sp.]
MSSTLAAPPKTRKPAASARRAAPRRAAVEVETIDPVQMKEIEELLSRIERKVAALSAGADKLLKRLS